MKHGDPITIVLKHPANIDQQIGKDLKIGRLIHTSVLIWSRLRNPDVRDVFEANDDDRVAHRLVDLGVTYLLGHVPFDSPEALELVRLAEEADACAARADLEVEALR